MHSIWHSRKLNKLSHILTLHPYLFSRLIFHTYFVNPHPPSRFLSHFSCFLILFVFTLIMNTVLSDGIELMTLWSLRSHTELRGSRSTVPSLGMSSMLQRCPESEIRVFKHRSRISYMIPIVNTRLHLHTRTQYCGLYKPRPPSCESTFSSFACVETVLSRSIY